MKIYPVCREKKTLRFFPCNYMVEYLEEDMNPCWRLAVH